MNYLKIETLHKILDLDTKTLSRKELIKHIESVQAEIQTAFDKRKEANHKSYNSGDLANKRKARAIANSKSAIKKFWKDRKNKKDLILKHIKKIRNIDEICFSNEPAKKKEYAHTTIYEKDEKTILLMRSKKKSYQAIVNFLGYGTKQSLHNYVKKINLENSL